MITGARKQTVIAVVFICCATPSNAQQSLQRDASGQWSESWVANTNTGIGNGSGTVTISDYGGSLSGVMNDSMGSTPITGGSVLGDSFKFTSGWGATFSLRFVDDDHLTGTYLNKDGLTGSFSMIRVGNSAAAMRSLSANLPDQQSNNYIPSTPKPLIHTLPPPDSMLFPPGTDAGAVNTSENRDMTIPGTGEHVLIPKGYALWVDPGSGTIKLKKYNPAEQVSGAPLNFGADPQLVLLDPNRLCKGGNYGFISPNCYNIRALLDKARQSVASAPYR